jgi:hypothetical protein
MSSSRFDRMPELKAQLGQIRAEIQEAGGGGIIDPDRLIAKWGWRPGETLGLLRLAQEAGLGRLRLRVIGDSGEEVGRFDDLASIPPEVPDEFGQLHRVTPDRVEVFFEAGLR